MEATKSNAVFDVRGIPTNRRRFHRSDRDITSAGAETRQQVRLQPDPAVLAKDGLKLSFKRTLDLSLAAFFLALLALPMLLMAALIKLTSRGPALYTQERIGLDGREFRIYKFRTMHDKAEAKSGPVWARDNDPRCTWFGKILRHTSLDEIPQLLNVVRGEMSLVGPRPERPFFVQQFAKEMPDYVLRHQVRPGLTGWAQVHGLRGNTCLRSRLEHDLQYINKWSLALDLYILVVTPLHVWWGWNAR